MRYAIILLLSGCATYPIPADMVVTETHYTDPQLLAQVCHGALACTFVTDNVCDMHLPLAANGDPMYREHELAHCGGNIDSPQRMRY